MLALLVCNLSNAQNDSTSCKTPLYSYSFYQHDGFYIGNTIVTPTGEMYLGCSFSNYQGASLIKLNNVGDTVFTKVYSSTTAGIFTPNIAKAIVDYDGNLLLLGDNNLILKTDTAGNPLYGYNLTTPDPDERFSVQDICVLANGDKALLFLGLIKNSAAYLLAITDKDIKTIKWSKLVTNPDYNANTVASIGANNDKVVMSLTATHTNNYITTGSTTFTLFDANSGTMLGQHSYNGILDKPSIYPYNGGYIIISPSGYDGRYYIRTDAMLNIISTVNFPNTELQFFNTNVNNDGSFTGILVNQKTLTMKVFVTGTDDKIKWADSILNFYAGPAIIAASKTGFYIAGNVPNNYDPGLNVPVNPAFIYKGDVNGNFGFCVSQYPLLLTTAKSSFAIGNIAGIYQNTSMLSINNAFPFETPYNNWWFTTCTSTIMCSNIKIAGDSSVCASKATYTGKRNTGCTAPITWSLRKQDSAYATMQTITDSTIVLSFLKSGSYTLYATITNSCGNYADTLIIHANTTTQTLYLGHDTTLCAGDTLLLHAGSNFKLYTWQDGSADSVFTVTTAGQYSVRAIDYCNDALNSAIKVSFVQPVKFALVSDTSKCLADTLLLKGFTSYSNITVSPLQTANVVAGSIYLYPTQTTTYNITAADVNGCKVAGNININIYPQPIINLGRDTSICIGDSVTLDAGAGFTKYVWSTGNSNQMITISQQGKYTVTAFTAYGCLVKDSFTIVQIYPLPKTGLDTTTSICYNGIKQLSAASGFISYLWNNGSTGSSIMINSTGAYWVQVTDSHNCISKDTDVISTILPLPQNFIPADTAYCNYETLVVTAKAGFKNYLWSNNSTQPDITIYAPGVYWLQVTDNNNCTATDTLTVAEKQCIEGFYAPTAFTPNGDGRNDVYKPLLFGNISAYKFTIYNRWGAKVFETTNPQNGWDGTLNGLPQQTGSFVWYCTYQLSGQQAQLHKGTVTLVR